MIRALSLFFLLFGFGSVKAEAGGGEVMFSLMHGLWSYMFSKTEFHVLILGIDKAGKTVHSQNHLVPICVNSIYLSLSEKRS